MEARKDGIIILRCFPNRKDKQTIVKLIIDNEDNNFKCLLLAQEKLEIEIQRQIEIKGDIT